MLDLLVLGGLFGFFGLLAFGLFLFDRAQGRRQAEDEDVIRTYEAERERRRSEYERSNNRSIALLKSWLSPAQLKQYEESQSFEAVGSETGRTYVIAYGRTFNVWRGTENICFAPLGILPVGDVMLAQKIALENDEAGAMRVANGAGPMCRAVANVANPVPMNVGTGIGL